MSEADALQGAAAPRADEYSGPPQRFHGGRLIARRLRDYGTGPLFTLSGGHLFSIYDGCVQEQVPIVDVRHESTAAFAAEGWAKVTRSPGVCALTAGPGVTNGMSALASAQASHSPMVVLGGRAPAGRWGQGSLQEIDHLPFVRPLCRMAATAQSPDEIQDLFDEALRGASMPHGGPAFLDFPLDYVFMEADERPLPSSSQEQEGAGANASAFALARELKELAHADGPAIERALALLEGAERPVIMAGTDLYWGHAEQALIELAEKLRIPVFLNGAARGCLPADHQLFFSRARSKALAGADVALVIGVPMDFRLGFGHAFGPECEIVAIDAAEPQRRHPREVAAELYGSIAMSLQALTDGFKRAAETTAWLASLREDEQARRQAESAELQDDRAPLHPMRIYGELAKMLDRNAVVICDGGDFVSYAGRMIDSYEPGCWLDPGPFGCLGTGPGYALAAKLAHPDRQVVLLLGDGAFGFAGMEFDTLCRHGVNIVGVMGNNGIWGLEKHPMEFVYGYSVAAELRPGTRYEQIVEILGGHGELVERPPDLRGALERSLAAGKPALVNVLTDPAVAYPRKANLA